MLTWCMLRAAGDVERDFWLAMELLGSPKDHAEFTIVRNWVRQALQVTGLSSSRCPSGAAIQAHSQRAASLPVA